MNDSISRQAAIDAICKAGCGSGYCGISCDEVKAIEQLPSAQPEKRTQERTETHACDLISRQAAIAVADSSDYVGLSVDDVKKVTDEVVKGLKRLPSAQQWIPCSERLPEEEKKTYWVCTDTEYQCECRWTNNRFGIGEGEWGWSIFDTPQYTKPIAWMPMPEPYKGEKE